MAIDHFLLNDRSNRKTASNRRPIGANEAETVEGNYLVRIRSLGIARRTEFDLTGNRKNKQTNLTKKFNAEKKCDKHTAEDEQTCAEISLFRHNEVVLVLKPNARPA